ncbi:MAG TPA: DUF488 family protein [Nitrospira sp.]|nr:DUF488 family protein [Nitrospira sp.]
MVIPVYRQLAPGPWFRSVDEPEYRRRYFEQLCKLDARTVWDELHELAGGSEPVLLCFERPPFSAENWCHRRMVAEWFARELAADVPELEVLEMTAQQRLF